MAQDARAGGAYVEVYVRDKLKQGMDKANAELKASTVAMGLAGGALMGVATASLGAAVAAIGSFASSADTIADTSAKIGVTAEALQQLTFAAEQSGASMEDVSAGIGKFAKLVGAAEMGQTSAIETLKKYGLSLDDLKTMSPDKQLQAVADVIASMPDPATKTAAAMALLGKGGASLVPMLAGGSKSLQSMANQANALGIVLSSDDVAAGGKLADSFAVIQSQAMGLVNVIGASLTPTMQSFVEVGRGVLAWSIAFANQNRETIVWLSYAAAGVGALGAALTAYYVSAKIAAVVSGAFAVAQGVAAAATAILGAALGSVAGIIAIVVVAAGALAGAVLYLVGAFDGLGEVAGNALGGIRDAILGGNLTLAMQIATTGMELAWVRFQQNLFAIWERIVAYILAKTATLRESFASYLKEFQDGMEIVTGGMFKRSQQTYKKGNFSGEATAKTTQDSELDKRAKELELTLAGLNSAAAASREALDGVSTGAEGAKVTLPDFSKAMKTSANAPQSFSYGTFSSAGAMLLGFAPQQQKTEEKMLDVMEESLDELSAIRQSIEEGGLVFA